MMKFRDSVEAIRGFNKGRKGKVYARIFWIYYIINEDFSDNTFDCFWFNLNKLDGIRGN